tara:strand:+ start:2025 stop:2294 length:270 start_codon:yes stop_codon:yes gene_type:complete
MHLYAFLSKLKLTKKNPVGEKPLTPTGNHNDINGRAGRQLIESGCRFHRPDGRDPPRSWQQAFFLAPVSIEAFEIQANYSNLGKMRANR